MTASHGVTLGKGDTTLAEIAAIADGARSRWQQTRWRRWTMFKA
ncbi:hypothetical protein SODG_006155 [Sodalis praecaptivus]